jgi:hypothetical protein
MTELELNELCAEWQEELRLRDWRIVARIRRERDMPVNAQGAIDAVWGRKEAVISILDPIDYPGDLAWPQDMEATLVHEMLHLHFPEWRKDVEEDTDVHLLTEQGVDMIAHALIDFKRRRA